MPSSSSMLFGSESWSNSLMLSGWVDVSGDGWGVFGVHVLSAAGVPLKIGCLTTSSRFFSNALLTLGGL